MLRRAHIVSFALLLVLGGQSLIPCCFLAEWSFNSLRDAVAAQPSCRCCQHQPQQKCQHAADNVAQSGRKVPQVPQCPCCHGQRTVVAILGTAVQLPSFEKGLLIGGDLDAAVLKMITITRAQRGDAASPPPTVSSFVLSRLTI